MNEKILLPRHGITWSLRCPHSDCGRLLWSQPLEGASRGLHPAPPCTTLSCPTPGNPRSAHNQYFSGHTGERVANWIWGISGTQHDMMNCWWKLKTTPLKLTKEHEQLHTVKISKPIISTSGKSFAICICLCVCVYIYWFAHCQALVPSPQVPKSQIPNQGDWGWQ